MKNKKVSILVDSFDGYSDVWPYFFETFHRFWSDCPYDIFLTSNYLSYESVNVIKTGVEKNWISRTIIALKNIKTPFVMLLLEDYFFSKKIDKNLVEFVDSALKQKQIRYLRLVEIPKSRARKKGSLLPILKNEEYGINLQASIWRVDFLKEILLQLENGSAWDFEVALLKRIDIGNKAPLEGCFTLRKNPFGFHNGILKGKWFPKEISFYKKKGIIIDCANRGKLSRVSEVRFVVSLFLKEHIPYSLRRLLKRILRKMGFKFVSNI